MTGFQWVGIGLLEVLAVFAVSAASETKPATAPQTAPTYHVGDCYGGGVIFYVNKSPNAVPGQQGLIVAPADVASSFPWDTQAGGQDVATTQPVLFTGCTNTTDTLTKLGKSRAQAASAAHSYTDGQYHDWVLPSQMELSTLYFQAAASGPSFWTNCKATPPSGATYWTSTQSDPKNAWGVSFAGGVVVIANKNNPLLVRAVRVF